VHAPTAPILRLSHISKRFGSLLANHDISLDLARGEVLALLGENGAGKSTLVSILFGHYVADEGEVEVDGRRLPPGQPNAALAGGIGMVHQHFTLADNLSVLDNVMLGTEPLWRPRSRRREARARLLDAARRFGLAANPDARVAELSVGERQRVEILKALYRGARILILDEPTAVLTPQESESLFATLAQMVAAGLAIVFISHKLDEVLRVADRIAVLRAGRLVALLPRAGADKAQLAEHMVGHAIAAAKSPPQTPGALRCELQDAVVRERGRLLLDHVGLAVRAGEILAVAGVAGNGQRTLADVLNGVRALDAGRLLIHGRPIAADARRFVAAGVARIPEDRQTLGVVGEFPVWENLVLERYRDPRFASAGWVRRRRAIDHARALVERFDVRGLGGAGPLARAGSLSGGNLQKLILARSLAGGGAAPRLIVADQPTWGLDVGAVAHVHQALLDAAAAGAAVVLISEDLDEIFAIADRIAVIRRGALSQARPRGDWTLAAIGMAMTTEAHDAARAA
jgi:simple sugar transport system ATP-binding protein